MSHPVDHSVRPNRSTAPLSNSSTQTLLQPRKRKTSQQSVLRPDARPLSSQPVDSSRRRQWKTRGLLLSVAVIGLFAVGFSFSPTVSRSLAEQQPAKHRAIPVKTMRAELVSSYHVKRQYTGEIVAKRRSELGFERTERLVSVFVQEGDSVAVGEPLATIDRRHSEAKRRELRARRDESVAKLDEMVAGPRIEDIQAARAQVESFAAQVALLALREERNRKLLNRSAISQDQYDEVAFGLRTRRAQHKQTKHALAELLNGTRKEQIRAQQAVVEELEAAIANVEIDLAKSTLVAPFAGTVSRLLVDEGTVVRPGQPVLKLVENDALEAWIGLPIQAAIKLQVGDAHRIRAGRKTYVARISGLLPEIDPATRTRTVVLELTDSASRELVHGQVIRLELEATVSTDGYWVPTTALAKGSRGLWSLYAVVGAQPGGKGSDETGSTTKGLRAERRDVEVLHNESDRVLVRGTLRDGERMIVAGTHRVVSGQRVRLIEQ